MYPNNSDQQPGQPQQPTPQPQPQPAWSQSGGSFQPQQQQQYPQQPVQPQPQPTWGQQPGYQPQQPYQQPPQSQPQFQQPAPGIAPISQMSKTPIGKLGKGPSALLFNDWMQRHWKLTLLIILGVIILGVTIFQIVYPSGRLLPGTKIDGIAVGGLRKTEAAEKLNALYGDVKLKIFFGKNEAAFQEPKLKEVGISVLNQARVDSIEYPFYFRIVPGSFLWVNSVMKPGQLEYAYDKQKIQTYTQSKVGDTCTVPAQDATLKLVESQLQVVPSVPGGVCEITKFQQLLAEARPTADSGTDVRVDSVETPAKVDEDKARALADVLNTRMKTPMPMSLGDTSQDVPGRVVLGWLDFESDVPPDDIDNSGNDTAKLVYVINKERMSAFINSGIASKVIKQPGVTKISTIDFKETSRSDGVSGTELDIDKVLASIQGYIDEKSDKAIAVTRVVGPTFTYTRAYNPTSVGFNAMLAQFANDNPGTYGLAFSEMGGVRFPRSASFNADTKFASAGAESIYLGYAVLMEQANGGLRAVDKVAGTKDVDKCFDDMIIKSNNECRLGLYTALGYARTTARGAQLGLKNTVFADRGGVTSANDLHATMIKLFRNEIAKSEKGPTLLATAGRSEMNEGIPAGNDRSQIALFSGENGTARSQTALVYSDKGTYVLTVVSDGSSWEKIAELTKKIQALKAVKVPDGAR